jgi:hypothetical protein
VGQGHTAHIAAYGCDVANAARRPDLAGAGYLGMSAQMIERTYGHHHPDYMRGAATAISTKQQQNISGQRKNVSLVVSLVEPEPVRTKGQKA